MVSKNSFLIGLIALLNLYGCKSSDVPSPVPTPVADAYPPSFFVNKFILEAEKRQINIKDRAKNLPIELVTEILGANGNIETGLAGVCIAGLNKKIQLKEANWKNLDSLGREFLMSHELGHCVLDRTNHLNELLPNGEMRSLMFGTPPALPNQLYFNFRGLRKDYYYDELFKPVGKEVALPTWGNPANYLLGSGDYTKKMVVNENFENLTIQDCFVEILKNITISKNKMKVVTDANTRGEIMPYRVLENAIFASENNNYEIDIAFKIISGNVALRTYATEDLSRNNFYTANIDYYNFSIGANKFWWSQPIYIPKSEHNVLIRKINNTLSYFLDAEPLNQIDLLPSSYPTLTINNSKLKWHFTFFILPDSDIEFSEIKIAKLEK